MGVKKKKKKHKVSHFYFYFCQKMELLVFIVTPFKIDQNKNQNRSIKSRIWEMKGVTYTKTLAKIQVRGIFRIRDIRRNVLPKLKAICMETPCWCSALLDELQHGGRKPTETSVTVFGYKSVNLFFEKLINIKVILFLIRELFR